MSNVIVEFTLTLSDLLDIGSTIVACTFVYRLYKIWSYRRSIAEDDSMRPTGVENTIKKALLNHTNHDDSAQIRKYRNAKLDKELLEGVFILNNGVNMEKLYEMIEVPFQYQLLLKTAKFTTELRYLDENKWEITLAWWKIRKCQWTIEIGKRFKGRNPETYRPEEIVTYAALAPSDDRIVSLKDLGTPLSTGLRKMIVDRHFYKAGFVQTIYCEGEHVEQDSFPCVMYFDRVVNQNAE